MHFFMLKSVVFVKFFLNMPMTSVIKTKTKKESHEKKIAQRTYQKFLI